MNTHPFESSFFNQVAVQLIGQAAPVILLEGTRKLPSEKRKGVVAMGQRLAEVFPDAIFRSGNAAGTDDAFAEGVASVPGARLELVLPTSGMGRSRRPELARCIALCELPDAEREQLTCESLSASPQNRGLFKFYLNGQPGHPAYAKAQYLVRDALKVCGSPALKLSPASLALFFIDESKATGGGTGHTIRLCQQQEVPVFTQKHWLT